MDNSIILATTHGVRVTGSKEAIKEAYTHIVRTIILSTALDPAEIISATKEGIYQGEADNDSDWVL